MRKRSRAVVLVFVSLLTTFLLGIASAFVSALALGATALIVPGTGTPNANIIPDYLEHARDYYMKETACNNTGTSNGTTEGTSLAVYHRGNNTGTSNGTTE